MNCFSYSPLYEVSLNVSCEKEWSSSLDVSGRPYSFNSLPPIPCQQFVLNLDQSFIEDCFWVGCLWILLLCSKENVLTHCFFVICPQLHRITHCTTMKHDTKETWFEMEIDYPQTQYEHHFSVHHPQGVILCCKPHDTCHIPSLQKYSSL